MYFERARFFRVEEAASSIETSDFSPDGCSNLSSTEVEVEVEETSHEQEHGVSRSPQSCVDLCI